MRDNATRHFENMDALGGCRDGTPLKGLWY
jgi:hypothetical protein